MSWFTRKKDASQPEKQTNAAATAKKNPTEDTDIQLAKRTKRMHTAVAKVTYGAELVEEATQQLLNMMDAINEQMAKQQAATDRAAAIISELGAFSQEVTASVSEVGASSNQSALALQQGQVSVQQSIEFINQMQGTVEENADAVRGLVEQTMEIDNFVATIREIANQTNLLALNAAIEAARAGAEGRGFAVVADEVKKLAETSAASAVQISKLLDTIKSDASLTIQTMQNSVTAVSEGCKLITETSQALDEIMSTVAETTALVQEISSAVTQQAENNEQLMRVTENTKEVLEKAAFYIETAAFDTEQQRASMQTLLQVTADLQQVEAEMRDSLAVDLQQDLNEVYAWGLPQDPVTLDPALSRDSNSNNVIREIFAGLLEQGDDGKPIPAIASTWHLEDDGRTYTFMLRPNVYFHHGRQVEADDVKYSLERLLAPGTKSPHGGLLQSIVGAEEYAAGKSDHVAGIKVWSKNKVSITLTSPNLIFLYNLANRATSIVPREIVQELGNKFGQQPVGAGAFVFEHWTPGKEIILQAHQRHFEGRPFVDTVKIRIYPGADALLAGFLEGQVGHLRIDGRGHAQVAGHPVYSHLLTELPPEDIQYCALMNHKPPFDNKLIRKAANHAFDRQTYLRTELKNKAILCNSPIPAYYTPGLQGYRYDPARAKALMAQAGYPNGYPGEVILHVRANNQEQATRARAIQHDLSKIGINIKIVTIPWTEMVKPETMAQCHMFLMGATGGNAEPISFLEPYFHSRNIGKGNRVAYSNPEVDKLIDQIETMANPEQRQTTYAQIAKMIAEDAPWMFLFQPLYYIARQPYTKGIKSDKSGYVKLKGLWMDK